MTFPAGHALGFRDDRLEFVSIDVALEVQEVTKMYDELELEFQNSDSTGDGDHESIDETRCHTVEQFFNASDDQYRPDRHQIRAFLVACHLAAVSVETMSRQLGFDKETIRRELIFGLKAWTAAQRRSGEALHAEELG